MPLPTAEAHFTWNGTWLPEQASDIMARELRSDGVAQRAIDQLTSRLASSSDLRSLQMADMQEYLPHDILSKVDRVTMAHGLECRAPLLNPAVAEFGVDLDAREKVRMLGKSKWLLRALARRIFPKEISAARKQGFSIPVHAWLRDEMRDSLEHFLSQARLADTPFLDSVAVLARKDQHLAGKADFGFELWGLMALSAWWRHHSRRTVSVPPDHGGMTRIAFAPCHQALTSNSMSST